MTDIFDKMKAEELKQYCRDNQITGYSGLTKNALKKLIRRHNENVVVERRDFATGRSLNTLSLQELNTLTIHEIISRMELEGIDTTGLKKMKKAYLIDYIFKNKQTSLLKELKKSMRKTPPEPVDPLDYSPHDFEELPPTLPPSPPLQPSPEPLPPPHPVSSKHEYNPQDPSARKRRNAMGPVDFMKRDIKDTLKNTVEEAVINLKHKDIPPENLPTAPLPFVSQEKIKVIIDDQLEDLAKADLARAAKEARDKQPPESKQEFGLDAPDLPTGPAINDVSSTVVKVKEQTGPNSSALVAQHGTVLPHIVRDEEIDDDIEIEVTERHGARTFPMNAPPTRAKMATYRTPEQEINDDIELEVDEYTRSRRKNDPEQLRNPLIDAGTSPGPNQPLPPVNLALSGSINSLEETTVYHKDAIQLFFKKWDGPDWDQQLNASIDKFDYSYNIRKDFMNLIVSKFGPDILVSSIKSDYTLQEFREIVQLYFCLQRGLKLGTRLPSVGISLDSIINAYVGPQQNTEPLPVEQQPLGLAPAIQGPVTQTSTRAVEAMALAKFGRGLAPGFKFNGPRGPTPGPGSKLNVQRHNMARR